jgi:hypothetical protein
MERKKGIIGYYRDIITIISNNSNWRVLKSFFLSIPSFLIQIKNNNL